MKIISLNAYMGHVFDPLMEFFEKHQDTTDIFCLQEMMSSTDENLVHEEGKRRLNILQEISRRLPDFEVVFAPAQDDYEIDSPYPGQSQLGTAIFYRRTLDVKETGSFFIYNEFNSFVPPDWETLGHNMVFMVLRINGKELVVSTLHGNSQPSDKLDSPKRLAQFQKVLDFLLGRDELKILMGDFNALPETEGVKMFEKAGLNNLIDEYEITTTRGSHMRKLFPEYKNSTYGFQEFADYTFLSPEIKVTSFEVPDEPISDHLPMILEIEI
mgnify:CR=1 FL=1|jgi:endonuclease/exonuclease/phosphatase family metal-dependent hydrolase